MCLKRLRVFFLKLFFRRRPKISLLIPFSSTDPVRRRSLEWLLKYWKHELPKAQIVIGHSSSTPFCKGEALNNAAQKATGKILVILDADAYLSGSVITRCADRILEEEANGNALWYVPYRHLYRLKEEITKDILASDPLNPLRLPIPPIPSSVENNGDMAKYGHRYGAMITIFSREALNTLGCFDERFKGWGGEDVCFLRALDTLYGKHKTTKNAVFHLWHPFIGDTYKIRNWERTRKWEGQVRTNSNGDLSSRYNKATRNPSQMRKLVDEGCRFREINLD